MQLHTHSVTVSIEWRFSVRFSCSCPIEEFKAVNWLPIKNRIDQCVCVNIMKFCKETAPAYSGEIFHPVNQGRATRRSKLKLEFPFRKSSAGQKSLSYLGPKIWNSLPSELKLSNNINTFKHKIKENFFRNIQKEEDDICLLLRTVFLEFLLLHRQWPFFRSHFFSYTSGGTIMETRSH